MRHGACRASTTRHGEHIYSGGELRRSNPSELTWQKPTREESLTRHGEHTYSRGELSQKKYKKSFIIRSGGDHIVRCHSRKRENKGNTERTKGARSTRIEGRHKIIETSWLGSIPSLLFSL